MRDVPTAELFSRDPARFERFSRRSVGLQMDFSRQRIDEIVLAKLAQLADAVGLRQRIDAMWRGDKINVTEDRAVLHVALRQPPGAAIGGADKEREIMAERERMLSFAESVRSGRIAGSTNKPFNLVVNIGIGGSDLGPAMAVQALKCYTSGAPRLRVRVQRRRQPSVRYSGECRPCDHSLHRRFQDLRHPGNTHQRANGACLAEGEVGRRGCACAFCCRVRKSSRDGRIQSSSRVPISDVGLGGWPLLNLVFHWSDSRHRHRSGQYLQFLQGGHELDEHFRIAPWQQNLPVLAGLLGVWNVNSWDSPLLPSSPMMIG